MKMKVLMFSLDSSLLKTDSETAERMKMYGTICDELHIVVFGCSRENKSFPLAPNIFIYSANSLSKIFSLFRAYQIGKKILEKFKNAPAVITAQEPFEIGLVGWLLSKKFKTGFEAQLHGDFYGSQYWRGERLINKFRYILGKFILRRAKSIRVVSKRIEDSIGPFLKKSANGRSQIIRCPVYFNPEAIGQAGEIDLRKKYPDAFPIILSVGNLAPVKNHKLLIEVFAEIKKELPKAKLVIVGEGPLLEELRFKILALRLENDVELAGHQRHIADYYKSADIFVHPSLYEGWGRAVIEAAYFGLPIVMTDVGLAGEIIKNNESGLIVPVNDKNALFAAIFRFVQDEALGKRLAEGAKNAVALLENQEAYLRKIKDNWEANTSK